MDPNRAQHGAMLGQFFQFLLQTFRFVLRDRFVQGSFVGQTWQHGKQIDQLNGGVVVIAVVVM